MPIEDTPPPARKAKPTKWLGLRRVAAQRAVRRFISVRLQSEDECECFFFFLFPSALQRFAVLSCARRSLSCRVHVKNSRLAGLLDNLKWNYSACACVTEGARVCACVCMRTCVSQGLQKCFSQAEMLISGPMHQGSFSPLTSCSGKHGAET